MSLIKYFARIKTHRNFMPISPVQRISFLKKHLIFSSDGSTTYARCVKDYTAVQVATFVALRNEKNGLLRSN